MEMRRPSNNKSGISALTCHLGARDSDGTRMGMYDIFARLGPVRHELADRHISADLARGWSRVVAKWLAISCER